MHKFSNFGLNDGFLKLVSSYLQNRVSTVKVRSCYLSAKVISSGIPEGGILRHQVFLIYFNNLTNMFSLKSTSLLMTPNELGTVPKLFNANNGQFTDWSDTNKLSINLPMCQYFAQTLFPRSTTVLGIKLEESSPIKDLGLYISKNLTRDKHFKKKVDS